MSAEKNVPVYIEDENTGKLQIGWATPEVDGVRTVQRFAIFESLEVPNVIFGDADAPKEETAEKTEEKPAEDTAAEPTPVEEATTSSRRK